jgi:hypothetical protein
MFSYTKCSKYLSKNFIIFLSYLIIEFIELEKVIVEDNQQTENNNEINLVTSNGSPFISLKNFYNVIIPNNSKIIKY